MRPSLGPALTGALVLCLGLLASAGVAIMQRQANQSHVAREFDALARSVTAQLPERLHAYEKGLRGLRGAVIAAGARSFSHGQFAAYSATRDIDGEFPGARGMGVIWRVPAAGEDAFVRRMRADGRPGFTVRQIAPHEGERFVIADIHPLERNGEAVGLDIASEARRRAAADDAAARGAVALTAPITLVQAQGQVRRAFLMLLPIQAPAGTTGPAPSDQAAPQAAFTVPGWTYAPLVIDDVLATATSSRGHYTLRLRDVADGENDVFFDTGGTAWPGLAPWETTLALFGRTWHVRMQPTASYVEALPLTSPWHLGLALTLASLLLATLAAAAAQLRRRGRMERLASARASAIVSGSADAIIGEALDGTVIDWNAGAQRLFGHTTAEAIGRAAAELILPLNRRLEDRALCEAVARGEVVAPFDTTRLTRDGRLIEVSVSAAPMVVDGRCVGFAKTVRDIGAERAAQRALQSAQREQQALLKTLDEHSIISVADRRGDIVTVNDAFCRISGYERDQLVGHNHRIVNSGVHPRAFWIEMWRTLGSGRTWHAEVCNRAKDGSLYWVDSVVTPFFDAQGRIEKYVSIRTDITDRKRAEEATRNTLRLLQAVLEASTQVSIIASTPDGKVSLFNRGAENLLRLRAEEVIGRRNVMSFFDWQELRQAAQEASERLGRKIMPGLVLVQPEHLDVVREFHYLRSDGTRLPVAMAITAMHDEAGEISGYLGVAHDLTARREHEVSLHRALEEARLANEAKGRFLANMSHEIRTPLNAVIGLTHLLGRTALDVEQADTLSKIRVAGRTLLELITGVLDVSKIEAGALKLEHAPFALRPLFADLAAMLGPQAEAKGVALNLSLPDDLPAGVCGDSARLRQVLTNLLSNALKFTEHGTVSLEVAHRPGPDGSVALHCAVHDTGIGIGPQALTRLFAPFMQADESTTRRFGGTGLGLSIVKQLLALMGGEIQVASTPGVGSHFWFELMLPLAEPGAEERHEELAPGVLHLQDVRVLVADDNEINREVARRILEGEGAWVAMAHHGEAAVECVAQADPPLDIVLMDLHMPVLDGHEATRCIRSLAGRGGLPIVGLTADVSAEGRELALGAGMNAMLGKPLSVSQLVGTIRRHLLRPPALVEGVDRPLPLEGDWPDIDGIDGDDSRMRLGGDVALLRRALRRLLKDYDPTPPDAAGLRALAGRMHTLKGSAGMLGARRVEQFASRTEAACRVGNLGAAAARLEELNMAMAELRQGAAGFLERTDRSSNPEPVAAAQAPDAEALDLLIARLQRFELAAVDQFADLAPGLRSVLGQDRFATLSEHMDNLEFADAVEILMAPA